MSVKGKTIGKFWFSPNIPDEILPTVEELLLKYEWMLPTWVEQLRVNWSDGGENDGGSYFSAYVSCFYQYRWARITMCAIFLAEEPEERELMIRHELSHIVNAPLVSYVRDALDALVTEDDNIAKKLIESGLRERYESVTEDLAQIFVRG